MKELRLRGICDIEAANEFLEREFLGEVNGKFEKCPAVQEIPTTHHKERATKLSA